MKFEISEESSPSEEILSDADHSISIRADLENGDVHIECSTREALLEFAKSLMQEALYGAGEAEYYPLGQDGRWFVVNGARLSAESSRLFVWYPKSALGSNHSLQARRP